MKRSACRRILVGIVAVALWGCASSPTEVFEALEEAAREGNAAEFGSHFTEESRPFAEALMSLYSTHSPAQGPLSRPLEILARSDVRSETIDGRRAELVVESGNGASSKLVFEQEDDGWKLDILQTEKRNAER